MLSFTRLLSLRLYFLVYALEVNLANFYFMGTRALVLTDKPLAVMIEGVINFFTQVTSPVPARVYSEIVWRLGGILFGFHAAGGLSDPGELMRFPQKFWEAYQEGVKEEQMYQSLKECVESV